MQIYIYQMTPQYLLCTASPSISNLVGQRRRARGGASAGERGGRGHDVGGGGGHDVGGRGGQDVYRQTQVFDRVCRQAQMI